MTNINDLIIKKITIVIPHMRKNLVTQDSLKYKCETFKNNRNEKRNEKGKAIKLRDVMNFENIKGSNVGFKKTADFMLNYRWILLVGYWKLKGGEFSNLKWTLQTSQTGIDNWIMATTEFENNTSIKDFFGDKPFTRNKTQSKITKLIETMLLNGDKSYKSFGKPQIYIEVENLPLNKNLKLSNNFHWIGKENRGSNEIEEFAISWYYDSYNPGFIYSMPKERYMVHDYFWMGSFRGNSETSQNLMINNGRHQFAFLNNDWMEVNEITIKRLRIYFKQLKENQIKMNDSKEFVYGGIDSMNSSVKWSEIIKYNKIGDIGLSNEKVKIEYIIKRLDDLLLVKEEDKKQKQKRYNKNIILTAFATTFLSLVTVLVSILK